MDSIQVHPCPTEIINELSHESTLKKKIIYILMFGEFQ